MKFGVHLDNRGPEARGENMVELAVKADELGFDSVWASDHVVIPAEFESRYPYGEDRNWIVENIANYYEPLVTLTYIAASTQRIRVGTCVLVLPYRSPIVTAKMVATLDALSGGRVILGVGAGWFKEEFAALDNAPFDQRGTATDESIEIMRKLWKERAASYQGKLYRFSAIRAEPKPAQAGGPPIWVGGQSTPALRRVAEWGDGWLAIKLSAAEIAAKAATIRQLAEQAKRDPTRLDIAVWLNLDVTDQPREAVPAGTLSGRPGAIADAVGAYAKAGVTHLVLSLPSDLRKAFQMLERFTAAVMGRWH